jgi:hypothetical protein
MCIGSLRIYVCVYWEILGHQYYCNILFPISANSTLKEERAFGRPLMLAAAASYPQQTQTEPNKSDHKSARDLGPPINSSNTDAI